MIDEVTDEQILVAQQELSSHEGLFVEPASAAGVAGLVAATASGKVDTGQVVVVTVTGRWPQRRRHRQRGVRRRTTRGDTCRRRRRRVSVGLGMNRAVRVSVPRRVPTSGRASMRWAWRSTHDVIEAHTVPAEPGGTLTVAIEGIGADELPRDASHLVVQAMHVIFKLAGQEPPAVHLRCVGRIPLGRGLGSSAAAIVAGVLGARALVEGRTWWTTRQCWRSRPAWRSSRQRRPVPARRVDARLEPW